MAEWKRIFHNRRLCAALLVILLLNGFLFFREQKANDYGIDCTIPTFTISVSLDGSGYEIAQTTVDSEAAYERYLQWLEEYRTKGPETAVSELQEEKERLTELLKSYEREETTGNPTEVYLDYAAVSHLLKQVEYLDGYDDYLATIQANKEKLLSFSLFNDPDSFSGRNIIKTAAEFEALEGVSLNLGADGAVNAFMDFSITDYLLLAVLVLICISFLDERKKGLWHIVHALPNGRLRLALQRSGILFGVSVVSVVLLYGSNLLTGFSIYGGVNDLGCAVQSVEMLGKMPVNCTVGEFLFMYLLFKIGAAFLVALLMWLIFSAVNNVKYTLLITLGLLAGEYSLYTFLPVQSGLNIFKYFNIFTYITASDLYTNYLNIDLFGYPVGIREVSQYACLPLIVIVAAVCIVIHCHKRPAAGKDLLGRFIYGINRITDWFLCRLHLLGMELHKTLFIQKGVFILVLFLYLVSGLTYTVNIPVSSTTDAAARQYVSELAGEITDDTLQKIADIEAELDTAITAHEKAKQQYENGEMEYPQYDVFARAAETAQTKKEALLTVQNRIEELMLLGKEKGFTPWLIEDSTYEGTYGETAKPNQNRIALVALLTVALLLAGSVAYETQSGINYLLISTLNGRKKLLRIKFSLAAILTTVVWAIAYGLEFRAFLGVADTGTFAAAVQNLSMLENFPIRCNIGVFLAGMYLFRWLALFTCAMLTMLISSCVKKVEIAYITVCGVILLPSVLYLFMGLEPMKYLSLALPVEAFSLLTDTGGKITGTVCACMSVLGLLVMSWYGLRKKMRAIS